jgi:hypothetical protein
VDALVWGLSELFADVVAGEADDDPAPALPLGSWMG